MNKPASHSLYAKLTEEQRAQLYDWILTLGYAKTIEQVARTEPDGFGINTHVSSLYRFFRRYQNQSSAEDLAAARETPDLSAEDKSILVADAEQSYLCAGHRLATGPLNSEDFGKVGRWLESRKEEMFKRFYARMAEQNAALAQKKAALAEQRLELDHEKFRFNAARQALIHFAELALIAKNRDKDNEDKIRAAADLLFQPPPKPVAAALQPAPQPIDS